MGCIHYVGNQFCKLHNQKVASAYCGDICEERKDSDRSKINIGTIGHIGYGKSTLAEALLCSMKERY